MKRFIARSLLAALPIATVLTVATAGPAFAHERRAVGDFQFVVGWGDEPAYSGFKNSVQLILSEANGGAPVTDLGDSLKVEVIKGTDKMSVPLVADFRVGSFGTPGDYRAWLTPTRPGTYTFHFTGTLRGQAVDQSFTSSKTTFNDVEDVATIEFPTKDPSNGDLAGRIDREVPRLDKRADAVESGVQTAQASARRAQKRADSAGRVATVGVAVGAVGLLVGIVAGIALVTGRSRRRKGSFPGPSAAPEGVEQAKSLTT